MKNNIFLLFCSYADDALKKAWTGKQEIRMSRAFLIKYLFFTEEEMEDEDEEARLESRIYKWLQTSPDENKEKAGRKPKDADWLDIAGRIDRLAERDGGEDLKRILYEPVQRVVSSVSLNEFLRGMDIKTFKCELEKNLEHAVGTGLIEKSSSLGAKVAAFFIHGFMGRKVAGHVPGSIQTNYYLQREDMEGLIANCAEKKFVCVDGDAYSGKTTLLVKYAREHGIKTVCCTGAASYREVLDSIVIEEDIYMDSRKRKKLGYLLNADTEKIKEMRLGQLEELVWLVTDRFQGQLKDCKKLERLSRLGKIQVFLEPVRMFPFFQEFEKIQIRPFSERELGELFYLMKNKYEGIKEETDCKPDREVLEDVRKAVFGNPGLIILTAEYYWGMQASGKLSKSSADAFLKDIAYGRETESGKFYSVLHKADSGERKSQKQHNLYGHVRYLFEKYVPEEEKNAFYVLSLISSIDIEVNYIEKWFGISREILESLEWKGWCFFNADKMRTGIPQLVVHAVKKDVFKSAKDMEPFRTYIRNMTKTITGREVQTAETGMLQRVMLCLHNNLLYRIHEKPSKVDETVCEFHFACISYFLDYGNAAEARGLLAETFRYDGVKKCTGSSDFYKALMLKMEYMKSNNISSIVDDIIYMIRNCKIYESEYAVNAVYSLIELYADRVLAECGLKRLEPETNRLAYRQQLAEHWKLFNELAGLLRNLPGYTQERFYENELYRKMFEYSAAECDGIYLQRVCGSEQELLAAPQLLREKRRFTADREKELKVRALFLHLYAQFYVDEMISGRNWKRLSGTLLKGVISDRLEKILILREEMGELPINLADLYYAAVVLSCLIIDRKEDAQIHKADYSHVNFNNPLLSRELVDTINKFNYKIKNNGV